MKQGRIALTVSLPPGLAGEFGKLARREGKNKSQLFRDMIRAYREHRTEEAFFDLQHYGARQARCKGVLTEREVESLVFEGR